MIENTSVIKRLWCGKMVTVPVEKALLAHYRYMQDYKNKHGRVDGARSFENWCKYGEGK